MKKKLIIFLGLFVAINLIVGSLIIDRTENASAEEVVASEEETDKETDLEEAIDEETRQKAIDLFDELMSSEESVTGLSYDESELLSQGIVDASEDSAFVAAWNRTNCVNGLEATLVITYEAEEGRLEIKGEFNDYALVAEIDDTLYVIDDTRAIIFPTDVDQKEESYSAILLKIEDGLLTIKQLTSSYLYGEGPTLDGDYTTDEPSYTNENILSETFSSSTLSWIKQFLSDRGIDYEYYFEDPVKYGKLYVESCSVTYQYGAIGSGTWYYASIPHQTDETFNLFISNDGNIYFQYHQGFYTTDSVQKNMPEKR